MVQLGNDPAFVKLINEKVSKGEIKASDLGSPQNVRPAPSLSFSWDKTINTATSLILGFGRANLEQT